MIAPDTPAPSANVAKAVTKPKMRFLYPLAAVLAAAAFLAPTASEASARHQRGAGELIERTRQNQAVAQLLPSSKSYREDGGPPSTGAGLTSPPVTCAFCLHEAVGLNIERNPHAGRKLHPLLPR